MPNPGSGANPSGNRGSGDLAAPHPLDRARALAELIDPQAFNGDWAREETQREHMNRALHFAIRVIDLDWHPAVPVSADATAALVDLIRGDYPDVWSVPLPQHAEQIADAILAAGFRRVAEDDDTIERVGWAMASEVDGYVSGDLDPGEWEQYTNLARAAVRALRDGGVE